ncbi:glycoside hydrolase family 3 C-terminal domain-containing protein [Streptomyces sp. NBC_00963]|uniref:glycoside hydrolase family 3 C-terminal domain-containing protein n=1 Tax=Streptomyces sp. NBC_00963 TaxID=2903697 RepID=UPI003870D124|nr:glycoside hydrolase family 3 C-terminal domain-containing protein [Streptomyces sp. NBC_00963]
MHDSKHTKRPEHLTLGQKAALTSGGDFWHTQTLPKAGIAPVMLADGPHGLRKQPEGGDALGIGTSVPATCFPPLVGLGSSWNPSLVERAGRAIAREAIAHQVGVVLGPGVNIKRSPLGGRNFEYVSEDPLLTGCIGAAWVNGVQSLGVGTSLKHFAVNSQETDRLRVSAEVDERTLREIYLPAFEHIVTTARPTTVMCAYNGVNGVPCSQNSWLLTDVLRGEWGFDGLVVSDWGAVSDRAAALEAGLDLEMPPSGADHTLVEAVRAGDLDEQYLDASARRVLELIERTARARDTEIGTAAGVEEHHALARVAATESAVLLRNEGSVLPLDPHAGTPLAVIGAFAETPRFQGGGSSHVVPTRVDNALEAIRATVTDPARIRFAPGFTLDGIPDGQLVEQAVEAARGAAQVLLFLGLPDAAESEGFDRTDILLPADQLALLNAVAETDASIVVVLSNGATVQMTPWQDRTAAVLEGWLLGQAGGSALADLLFGIANPSGRLTETVPLRLEDTPSYLHFPGGDGHVHHGEGLFVGYRSYDTLGKAVAHPFGHGLSYTTFDYSDLDVTETGPNRFAASFTVTNSGSRAGAEVTQLYVHQPVSRLRRPVQELKAFEKVFLDPGEHTRVTLDLDERSFAYWSPRDSGWRVDPGAFELRIGASSRDVRLRATVHCDGTARPGRLAADSTIGEWLADPVGGPLLAAAMATDLADSPVSVTLDASEISAMAAALPLARIPAFLAGVTHDHIAALVAAADEARATTEA